MKLLSQQANDFYDINTVREIRIYFNEHNWDAILDSLFELGTDGRLLGDVIIDGRDFHNAGIRYKGYSSWSVNQVKNPFYIKLDESVKNENYEGYSKLKLSNVTHDPSFIREALSYEIARKYMPAGRQLF
jgi:spore coat protein CotH